MTLEEYQKQDLELERKIADLYNDTCDHELQIAANKRQMAALDWQRKQLYYSFINIPATRRKKDCKKIKNDRKVSGATTHTRVYKTPLRFALVFCVCFPAF